jgi:MFS family permease
MSVITTVEQRAMVSLAAIFLLRMLGLFIIIPVFAIYAKQLNHVTPMLVGVALGIYGLTQALFQIPFGFASDYLGRKPLIFLGLVLFAIGSVVAALSDSIYGVIVGRSLQGASAMGGVIMALVADLTREEVRVRIMAVIGITIGVAFALAMLLGPILSEWGGVKGLFWITAFFSLGAIGILILFVPTPGTLSFNNEATPVLRLLPKMLIKPELKILNFGICVLHASLVALFLKIPLALQSLGFEKNAVWQFYVPVFLSALLVTIPSILVIEQKKWVRYGIIISVLVLAISEVGVLYFFNHLVGLACSVGLFFTAFNILEASLPALVAKRALAGGRGTALGIYSSAQFLGLFMGGIIGGWLDSCYGMMGVLLFCVTLASVWWLWLLQEMVTLHHLREV